METLFLLLAPEISLKSCLGLKICVLILVLALYVDFWAVTQERKKFEALERSTVICYNMITQLKR